MQRLFFWFKLFFYSLLLSGFSAHAASLGDVRTSYPSDFGQALVGSAVIKSNVIQWIGTDAAISVAMSGNSTEFGLTGELTYLAAASRDAVNTWIMESPQSASLLSPQASFTPSVGYFFAPYQAGLQTNADTYYLNYVSQSTLVKNVNVQGTGVADNVTTPNMTVDVSIQGGVEGANCENVQNCKYVDVLPSGEVTFTVTPKSSKSDVQYAYVITRIEEVNNSCSSANTSFKTVGVTSTSLVLNDYYHIVDGIGPNIVRQNCIAADMPALLSVGKSYQFKASNVRDTLTGGYAQYQIFLNGHEDIDDTTNSKWPGSHKIYRLRTNSNVQPVTPNVNASFTVNNNNTSSVTLTAAASTNVSGASIASYAWTFAPALPDGRSVITTTTPILTLTQVGSYTVGLQATDSQGNKNATPITNTVTVKNATTTPTITLTASFTATPLTGTIPLSVALDASASTGAVSYSWQSSNQLSASGVKSNMLFSSVGTYTITLTTADGQGNTTTSTQTIIATAATTIPTSSKPTASFIVSSDVKTPLLLTLDASNSQSSLGNLANYEWYIINSDTKVSEHLSKTVASTTYTVPSKGSYVVTLIVTDSQGNKATTANAITVPSLNASFTATPTAGGYPLTVKLDASASTTADNNKIVSYKWFTSGISNILDGITSSVTFLNPLDYVITLFITDDKGQVDSSSQMIKVVNPLVPIADFVATPTTANGKESVTINLDASASVDPDGGSIVNYQWCCDASGGKTTTTPKTSVTFTDNRGGDYKFSLIVTDNDGNGTGTGSNSTVVEKTITLNKPEVKFCDKPDNGKTMVIYGNNDSLSLDISCSIPKPSSSVPNSQIIGYGWSVLDETGTPVKAFVVPASESPVNSVSLRYTPGNYTVLAKAVESYGLYGVSGTAAIAVVPPAIGDAVGTGVDPSGVTLSTAAKFYAGAFANGGVVNQYNATDKVDLLAAIAVDAKHLNQQVDILTVLWNSTNNIWYYKNTSGSFTPWDFSLASLGNATSAVTLNSGVRHVKVWNGSSTNPFPLLKGNYSLFVGYRLGTGDILFNLHPYSFTVQ